MATRIVWIPMCFDAIIRLITLLFVFYLEEDLYYRFLDDKFDCVLYSFDVISVLPFITTIICQLNSWYYILHFENLQLVFRCLELFSSSKILRITKDIPNILAIRITLIRALPHLIVPIYFYFAFNIFFGVIIYFIEPCYQQDICPWSNLFEASFYSVVTMTTSKFIYIYFFHYNY